METLFFFSTVYYRTGIAPSSVESKTNIISSRLDTSEDTSFDSLMKNSSQNLKQSTYQESKHKTNSGN
jgi:hypothetical protein